MRQGKKLKLAERDKDVAFAQAIKEALVANNKMTAERVRCILTVVANGILGSERASFISPEAAITQAAHLMSVRRETVKDIVDKLFVTFNEGNDRFVLGQIEEVEELCGPDENNIDDEEIEALAKKLAGKHFFGSQESKAMIAEFCEDYVNEISQDLRGKQGNPKIDPSWYGEIMDKIQEKLRQRRKNRKTERTD